MLKLLALIKSLGPLWEAIVAFFKWLEAQKYINQGRMERNEELRKEQDAVEDIIDDAASSGPSGVSDKELIRPRRN